MMWQKKNGEKHGSLWRGSASALRRGGPGGPETLLQWGWRGVVLGMGKGGDLRSCHALNGKTFKSGQSLPFALVLSLSNIDEILNSGSQDPGAVQQGGEHALEDRHEHSSHRKGIL